MAQDWGIIDISDPEDSSWSGCFLMIYDNKEDCVAFTEKMLTYQGEHFPESKIKLCVVPYFPPSPYN